MKALRVGEQVVVPWGKSDTRTGTVTEVWEDGTLARVRFPDGRQPLLLRTSTMERAS